MFRSLRTTCPYDTHQQQRLQRLQKCYQSYFGRPAAAFFSAPGRTELGGNHTDHNNGIVLAAAIDVDILAAASHNGESAVRLYSEGYEPICLSLQDTDPRPEERGTTAALLRGVCALLQQQGTLLHGCDIYLSGNIPIGVGLSSSAATEVLLAAVMDGLSNNPHFDPLRYALIGQTAENLYFGKPCGGMDQIACACGGCQMIDFADPTSPQPTALPFLIDEKKWRLFIVNTGGSHADLTADYAAIRSEMQTVAAACGVQALGQTSKQTVLDLLPALRHQCSDRAILRALHFFDENDRVRQMAQALERKDTCSFLSLVAQSGHSSAQFLQNLAVSDNQQPLLLAMALTVPFIQAQGGAVRVHGGGFAGTVQAYLPAETADAYRLQIEQVFGKNCCLPLSVRQSGVCSFEKGSFL